jgi:ketosteroid isomerase-like protein
VSIWNGWKESIIERTSVKQLIFGLCLLAGAASAQTPVVPASVDPTEAITRLREGLVDSFNKRDIERLLSHLDTNVVVTWQNGEVSKGPEGVRAYYQKMMSGDRPVVRSVLAKPEVEGRHVYGDWAVSWGNLNDTFTLTDGKELPFNSRFTATITRRGDRWLVTAFHASLNVFQNPVLTLAAKKLGLVTGLAGLLLGAVLGLLLGRLFVRRRT